MNQSPEDTKRQASAPNPWRQAVDAALVSAGLDCLAPDADPAVAILRLLEWHETTVLDPAISERAQALIERGQASAPQVVEPIPMLLYCPKCGTQHVDGYEYNSDRQDRYPAFGEDPAISWDNPPHRSHLCHRCGCIWRPADVPTTGVKAIATKGKADNWEASAPQVVEPVTSAARDVLAERRRQVEAEGWTPEHDDEHDPGELAAAGSAYALAAADELHPYSAGDGDFRSKSPDSWPWAESWWKPGTDPRRMLVKAGALILAEIERLDRAQHEPQHPI